MTRRIVVIAGVVVVALLLQSTVFADLRLLGVRPELVFLVTVAVAITEGPSEGAVVGFAGGLAQDFLLNQPKGITALTLTLLGYVIGLSRAYITSPSPLLPTALVAVGTAAGLLFYSVVATLLGVFDQSVTYAVKVIVLASLYNAVLTPIVYPALRRMVEGTRPRRVVRF